MKGKNGILACVALAALSSVAAAQRGQTFTETFDNNSNVGAWSFLTGYPVLANEFDRHGSYIREDVISFAPRASTWPGVQSIFTGDYRTRNVTSLGIDLRLFAVEYGAQGRPVSLVLRTDNGTPDDGSDDWGAYTSYSAAPAVGGGWRPYEYRIDSQSMVTPRGWTLVPMGENSPTVMSWPALMSDVDGVSFWMADYELFYLIQGFIVGLDNPRISWSG